MGDKQSRAIITDRDRQLLRNETIEITSNGETQTFDNPQEQKSGFFYKAVSTIRSRIDRIGEDLDAMDQYQGRGELTLGDELRVAILRHTDSNALARILRDINTDSDAIARALITALPEEDLREMLHEESSSEGD